MKNYDHLCCDERGIKVGIYNRFSSKACAEICMSIKKLPKGKMKDKKKDKNGLSTFYDREVIIIFSIYSIRVYSNSSFYLNRRRRRKNAFLPRGYLIWNAKLCILFYLLKSLIFNIWEWQRKRNEKISKWLIRKKRLTLINAIY